MEVDPIQPLTDTVYGKLHPITLHLFCNAEPCRIVSTYVRRAWTNVVRTTPPGLDMDALK